MIDAALQAASVGAARGEIVFPDDLHGFPGQVHGGGVAALFHRLTRPSAPVRLRLELLRGVPTKTPLRLVTGSAGVEARLPDAGARIGARSVRRLFESLDRRLLVPHHLHR